MKPEELPYDLGETIESLKHGSHTIECDVNLALENAENLKDFKERASGLFANLVCYQLAQGGKEVHVCNVGGGFTMDDRVNIQRMFDLGMVSKEKPLVLEVKANSRFEDGKLRHNMFIRIRNDKLWTQCVIRKVS